MQQPEGLNFHNRRRAKRCLRITQTRRRRLQIRTGGHFQFSIIFSLYFSEIKKIMKDCNKIFAKMFAGIEKDVYLCGCE
jgi:hypothetical protein